VTVPLEPTRRKHQPNLRIRIEIIDADVLVVEVQTTSLLWRKSLNNYSDRHLQEGAAWEEKFLPCRYQVNYKN